MKKYCIKNSLVGNYYPMYLNNINLGHSAYLYQITTPGLSEKLVPLISINKVGEITSEGDYSATENNMMSSDILATLIHSRDDIETKGMEYLSGLFKKDDPVLYFRGKEDFPAIEMGMDNNMQKSIIVNLRDELRWRCYRFYAGRYVDILWSPTQFAVFKICGNREEIWLEPVAVYENTDLGLHNPKEFVDNSWQTEKFSGKTKTSDLNRYIKRLEWAAFDKKTI